MLRVEGPPSSLAPEQARYGVNARSAGSVKNFLRLHFLFRRKPMEKCAFGTEDRKNFLCDLSAQHEKHYEGVGREKTRSMTRIDKIW